MSSSLGSSGAVERWWKKVEEKTFRLLLWTALIEMCASPTERKRVLDRASGMCLIMNQRNHIIYTQFIFIYKFEYKYISIPRRAIHFLLELRWDSNCQSNFVCVCASVHTRWRIRVRTSKQRIFSVRDPKVISKLSNRHMHTANMLYA